MTCGNLRLGCPMERSEFSSVGVIDRRCRHVIWLWEYVLLLQTGHQCIPACREFFVAPLSINSDRAHLD